MHRAPEKVVVQCPHCGQRNRVIRAMSSRALCAACGGAFRSEPGNGSQRRRQTLLGNPVVLRLKSRLDGLRARPSRPRRSGKVSSKPAFKRFLVGAACVAIVAGTAAYANRRPLRRWVTGIARDLYKSDRLPGLVAGSSVRKRVVRRQGNSRPSVNHPCLIPAEELALRARDPKERERVLAACEKELLQVIGPEYAGWGWRSAAATYAVGYRLVRESDPARADRYAKKALGLMKVLARHHNLVLPEMEYLGRGGGAGVFKLPMQPMPGQPFTLLKGTAKTIKVVHDTKPDELGEFAPILQISDSEDGAADYPPSEYRLHYHRAGRRSVLEWIGKQRPRPGSAYYVTVASEPYTVVPESEYIVASSAVTMKEAPAEGDVLFARYLSENYEQTGNWLGGVNSVQPDGPGYPMRSFNVGLAYAYDLLRDYPGLTPELRAEFCDVLNRQIDWYRAEGYEREGGIGNYFVRGYLTGVFYTAYATEGDNPRSGEWMTLSEELVETLWNSLEAKLASGYGPQGEYTNGVVADALTTLTLFKQLTGQDIVSSLAVVRSFVPATIHGTKPDRATFYDGGDWDSMPARPLTAALRSFIKNLPAHPMAAYARHFLREGGERPPGEAKDYTKELPPHHWANPFGPVYARSDWGREAVWVSLAASPILTDHQRRDQGHVTIQRGKDYLLMTGGGYGMLESRYANTLLFDNRDASDTSPDPPGQGRWGNDSRVIKYEPEADLVYAQADFTSSYSALPAGLQNPAKVARRSLLYIRPELVVVHDRAVATGPDVRRIFNVNFAGPPARSGAATTAVNGKSKLFMKTLLPEVVRSEVHEVPARTVPSPCFNYRETAAPDAGNFLHVFQAAEARRALMAQSEVIQSSDGRLEGAQITAGGTQWLALFAAKDQTVSGAFDYVVPCVGHQRHFVADLPVKAAYRVVAERDGRRLTDETVTSSASGTISFTVDAAQPVRITVTPAR